MEGRRSGGQKQTTRMVTSPSANMSNTVLSQVQSFWPCDGVIRLSLSRSGRPPGCRAAVHVISWHWLATPTFLHSDSYSLTHNITKQSIVLHEYSRDLNSCHKLVTSPSRSPSTNLLSATFLDVTRACRDYPHLKPGEQVKPHRSHELTPQD